MKRLVKGKRTRAINQIVARAGDYPAEYAKYFFDPNTLVEYSSEAENINHVIWTQFKNSPTITRKLTKCGCPATLAGLKFGVAPLTCLEFFLDRIPEFLTWLASPVGSPERLCLVQEMRKVVPKTITEMETLFGFWGETT